MAKNIILTSGFLNKVNEYARHGVTRAGLMSLIADQIKEIDTARKDVLNAIKEDMKTLSCDDACRACNSICPPVHGDDTAGRQALKRRRDVLGKALVSTFTDYDISREQGTFFPTYVGDKETRQAKKLLSVVEELASLGFTSLSDINLADLTAAVKAAKQEYSQDTNVETLTVTPELSRYMLQISAKVTGINQAMADMPGMEKVSQA